MIKITNDLSLMIADFFLQSKITHHRFSMNMEAAE